MEEKINKRLLAVGIATLLVTAVSITLLFGELFDRQAKQAVRQETTLIEEAYQSGCGLANLAGDELRITHIGTDGAVLFESSADADKMENHLERPEVQLALQSGAGEATRNSATMGYRTYYYAVRLTDGSVLRVSEEVTVMRASFDRVLLIVILIALLVLALSVLLSVLLTKRLVQPIEAMAQNLDEIDENVPYPELEPFARRIKAQQMRKNEIERMRREFTANVSHELKTPLTSISGYAELIENGMAKPQDVPGFAAKIHAEAVRLISVIGDIINLTEVEEMEQLDTARVDLREIAAETVEMLGFSAEKAGVELHSSGSKCFVLGDRKLLSELVYNLADNAIRYNRPGGSVRIITEHDAAAATLSVTDTGIGIPKECQDRVFERFYRVDKSRSKRTGGTGLGLAIVKHIALRHGATLKLESEPGSGTTVTVTFRLAPEEDAE